MVPRSWESHSRQALGAHHADALIDDGLEGVGHDPGGVEHDRGAVIEGDLGRDRVPGIDAEAAELALAAGGPDRDAVGVHQEPGQVVEVDAQEPARRAVLRPAGEPVARHLDAVLHVRVAVLDLAQVAPGDLLLQGTVVLVEALVEVHLQQDAGLVRRIDHLVAARDGDVQRLLAQDVEPCVRAVDDDLPVVGVGRDDGDPVQLLLGDHLLVVAVGGEVELLAALFEQRLIEVGGGDQSGLAE